MNERERELFEAAASAANDNWRFSWYWKTNEFGTLLDEGWAKMLADLQRQRRYYDDRARECARVAQLVHEHMVIKGVLIK